MPHMMPMLWLLIFIMSLSFLFILSSMIYFFSIPSIPSKKMNYPHHKWNWMW